MKESLMKSQEDPPIRPHSWSWTGSISLWAGLSWILASDPPLSELYLEALRTLLLLISHQIFSVSSARTDPLLVFGIHPHPS